MVMRVTRVKLNMTTSRLYMIVADGKPLETGKRETREFKTLDAAA